MRLEPRPRVNVNAFRIFRTRLRVAFEDYRSPSVSIDVLLSWATQAFGAVRVRHEPRRSGSSSYTLAKLVTHAFNMVTGFSTLPLRMVSIIGFTFTLFGLFVLMWVLGQYLVHGSVVPGFVFLATIVAPFSGVQLRVWNNWRISCSHIRTFDGKADLRC